MLTFIYVFFAVLLIVFNLWNLYNIPALVVGVLHLVRSDRKKKLEASPIDRVAAPMVSIIVPVKNEEKVIGRLLKALVNLNYPSSKIEIIVINDGSGDGTREICECFAMRYRRVTVINRVQSSTKAAALNHGMQQARGEIIATFDADSVPETDSVLNALRYFKDPRVAAVQGRVSSLNADENMLTRFLSFEGALQFDAYFRGKDKLNLFVGLAGTCQFVRRKALETIGGWSEESLSEDTELSLRLIEKDYNIRYASDVQTWEESPHDIGGVVKQRARWYRGNIAIVFRFGRLMRKFNRTRFDAEMTLFGTFLIMLFIVSYFMAAWSFVLPPDSILTLITRFTSFFAIALLAFTAVALICIGKPIKISNLLWFPFIYVYWGIQSFIVIYALVQILSKRPAKWSKTVRSGKVTNERMNDFLAKLAE